MSELLRKSLTRMHQIENHGEQAVRDHITAVVLISAGPVQRCDFRRTSDCAARNAIAGKVTQYKWTNGKAISIGAVNMRALPHRTCFNAPVSAYSIERLNQTAIGSRRMVRSCVNT